MPGCRTCRAGQECRGPRSRVGDSQRDLDNPLTTLADDEVIEVCKKRFRNELNETPEAWDALGKAFHDRLERNYVTWVRHYLGPARFRTFAPDDLRDRAVTWTIGGLSPVDRFIDNKKVAAAAGFPVGTLPCRHFPQVSIPDVLANHIAGVTPVSASPVLGDRPMPSAPRMTQQVSANARSSTFHAVPLARFCRPSCRWIARTALGCGESRASTLTAAS